MDAPTRGERTRADILDSAYRLFIEQGYHGTSMRQIAEHTGLALGGIYNHFDGKEDIFAAVFLERHPYFDMLPAINAAQGDTIAELVHDAAARLLQSLETHPGFLNLVFIELVEFNNLHIPQLIHRVFPELLQFAARLDDPEGNLRPLPLPARLRAFLGLFFSYYLVEKVFAAYLPDQVRETNFEDLVDVYLYGILDE